MKELRRIRGLDGNPQRNGDDDLRFVPLVVLIFLIRESGPAPMNGRARDIKIWESQMDGNDPRHDGVVSKLWRSDTLVLPP